ncbi:MAG: DUF3108 domain-containing protein [Xanthomonadaceae bacterium]|nr:DUF3108 domain-containing protein [Xanthomonadaceae bacterium]
MNPKHLLLALALLLPCAIAQAASFEPFKATYEVWVNGKRQGLSIMTLSRNGDGLWRYDIKMEGTQGMARFLGAEVDQTTTFEMHDGRPRPITATSFSKVMLKTIERSGHYDWQAGEARWEGDLKAHRLGPVSLSPGDLNSGLINLALAQDVQARPRLGEVIDYRLVDEGRVRDYQYRIESTEMISVGETEHSALRVARGNDERRQIAWIVAGLQLPARVLEENEGKPGFDLRLLKIE